MDSNEILLIILLSVFAAVLLLIIVCVSCWFLKRNDGHRGRRRHYRPDEERPLIDRLSQPGIDRAQQQERSSLLTCHFYIRTTGDYTFHSQLSQLGSDPEKSWFLITPINKTSSSSGTASHLLTIHPKPERLNHLTDEDNTAVYFRTLNSLFGRLHHPYVEPIVRLDFLYTQKAVVTVKRYQRLGSLKDLLHGVTPTANFHVGFCFLFYT